MPIISELKQAGFNKEEINKFSSIAVTQNADLTKAGFTQAEINEHIGFDISNEPEIFKDRPEEELKLTAAPDPTIRDRFNAFFREKPEKLRAKAQNAMAMSELFNISPSQAYENHDELAQQYAEQTGLAMEMTPSKFYSGLFLPPIAAGLAVNPISTLIGLTAFESISEAESAAINFVQGTDYKIFQRKGLVDLLPEDTNKLTESVVELFDFIGKASVAGGVTARLNGFSKSDISIPPKPNLPASEFTTRLTKDIITEHKLPENMYIDPVALRTELQKGGVLPARQAEIIGEISGLGKINGEGALKVALREGVHIEFPAEKITIIRDKPWFAKVKKLFKLDPAQEKRIEVEGEKVFKFEREGITPKTKEVLRITNEKLGEFVVEPIKKISPEERITELEAERLSIAELPKTPERIGVIDAEISRLGALTEAPKVPLELSEEQITAIFEGEAEITEAFEVKPVERKLLPTEKKPKLPKLKTRVREITGQTKISDLVREDFALRESFRQAQKASRVAFREGRKEGVVRENLRLKSIAQKAKVRQEAMKQVRSMVKSLKKIKKDVDKFSPAQAKPVKDLLDSIDLVRLNKPTKSKLESTRKFVLENPNVELPEHILNSLNRLDKVNISDLTFDELEDVFNAVMHEAHLNKLKQSIQIKRKIRKAQEVVDESIAEMKSPKEVDAAIISSQKGKFEGESTTGNLIKNTFGIRHDAYDLIIESISGINSTIDKVLFQEVKDGVNKQLKYRQGVYDTFQSDLGDFQKKHAVNDIGKWLDERVEIDGLELTRNERMSLLLHSKNKDNRTAILEGGFGFRTSSRPNTAFDMKESQMAKILDDLTPAELDFSGKPVENLFTNQFEEANKVFLEKNGYEVRFVPNYYPKNVMPISLEKDLDAETALDQFRGKWTRVGINKDMLRPRVGSKKPIYLNGLTYDINKSVMKAAAYIGLEIPMSNASKLLYNKDFKANLIDRYERITWTEIEKGLRDIAGDYKSYTTVETLLLRAKNNLSTAFLGLNPYVMAKQVLSLPIYTVFVKTDFVTQGFMDYLNNPTEIVNRHKLFSPGFRERVEGGYSRDVADVFKAGTEKRIFAGKKTIKEKTLGGIQLFDEIAVASGMQGAVLQVISEIQSGKLSANVKEALDMTDKDIVNITPEEKMKLAYKFADVATERTQPMFSPEHRSSLSRGSTPEQLATMFGSFTNRALNLLRRTYRQAKRDNSKEADAKFVKALFTVLILNSAGVTAIDTIRDKLRGKEVTGKDIVFRVLNNIAGYMFFVRDVASSVISKIRLGKFLGWDVELPISRLPELFVDTVVDGTDALLSMIDNKPTRAKDKFGDFLDNSISLLMMSKGLPYEAPKRIVEDLTGLNEKEKKVERPKIKRR